MLNKIEGFKKIFKRIKNPKGSGNGDERGVEGGDEVGNNDECRNGSDCAKNKKFKIRFGKNFNYFKKAPGRNWTKAKFGQERMDDAIQYWRAKEDIAKIVLFRRDF